MVEDAINAVSSNERHTLIAKVTASEPELDKMQLALDRAAIQLMTTHGPVAQALRMNLSIARITSELERMGDNAVNMCESIELLAERGSNTDTLQRLGALVKEMVEQTIVALKTISLELAQETILLDDQVDTVNDEIMQFHLTGGENAEINESLAQILTSQYLERIADQCTNVCEEIIYMDQGRDVRHRA